MNTYPFKVLLSIKEIVPSDRHTECSVKGRFGGGDNYDAKEGEWVV